MAHVAGTTVGRARATMETAQRLTDLPATTTALRAGSLSEVQVDAIAIAATANPRAESSLLRAAASDGVKGLKQACAKVEAAASTDHNERYATTIAVGSSATGGCPTSKGSSRCAARSIGRPG